jgi:DNA (cytosine-5)-methyltransferase 1
MTSSPVYYNENNSFCAQWLRNLMVLDLIPEGDVDERSIEDVCADDLKGYIQCHFFAGIGGWPYALRLAEWPDDRPVWTGSCPCQPFSQSGKRLGFDDERHLWPSWFWLIEQCRPAVLFGEQVGGRAGLQWLDLVFDDLEGCDYACGAVDLPAAGKGAPHIRQRLWWVGNTGDARLPDAEPSHVCGPRRWTQGRATEQPSRPSDPWRELEWIDCLDGRRRPTQPGIFPLAARVSGDVAKLRAYGNAIVPQVAAEIIKIFLDYSP